jgi:hypothetical protein
MVGLVEEKKKWNLAVYESVADAFDVIVQELFRGDKGTATTAACLMFLTADRQSQQRFVDAIKLAEGRGHHGTILDAARGVMGIQTGTDEEYWASLSEKIGEKKPSGQAVKRPLVERKKSKG